MLPWLAALCWLDWRWRRLPNWLTLSGAAVALVWRLGYGGLPALVDGFAAGMLAGFFLLLPFLLRGAGGGDVKMLFAVGAMLGWRWLMPLLVYTSFAGLILALAMLVGGRLDPARLRHYGRCLVDWRYDRAAGRAGLPPADSEQVRVPFSLAIAVGAVLPLLLAAWG